MSFVFVVVPLALVALAVWTGPGLRRAAAVLWVRARFDAEAYGLPPREHLNTDRAGPPMPAPRARAIADVTQDVRDGHWRAAAAYAEGAGQDWDERWFRLEVLLGPADQDDAWLRDWRAARPAVRCVAVDEPPPTGGGIRPGPGRCGEGVPTGSDAANLVRDGSDLTVWSRGSP
ncbi:hypothetical protein [Streptomyces sp. L2]|uniref:hypothetical protein n=1 Tax=Streptomyces sp. L2 TaxID=2162665 RepID=UPI001012170A|nr:hypothetical protein [Streptomyces sp. L2]